MMAVFIRLCIILSAAVLVSMAKFDYCKRKCPCDNLSNGVYYLPSENKTQFYQCNFGAGILMNCGPGTHFNPKYLICDWPGNAKAVKCKANHKEYIDCNPEDEKDEEESSGDEDS